MAKNYILNVKDTNGNWVPLQTLVGPKGDQGAQGPVGVGIKSITKENENLIITLTNEQRKELDLNITNTINSTFDNRLSTVLEKIRNNELSLTKTANELKIENNIIKYKENSVNKTIDLTPYINPTNQAIESIVQSKGQTLFESKDATIVKNLELVNKKLTFNSNGTNKEINLPISELPTGKEILNKINNDITNTSPEFISFKEKLNIPNSGQQSSFVVDGPNKTIHFGENTTDLYSIYANNINAKGRIITQDEIISSGDITAFSDIRLKTDIEKIENALDKVCQLSGYTYNMNDKRRTGVIAQEVEKVLPEVVQDREDGYKTVAYGNMIGLLIEAIKELKEEIKVIKNGN